MDRLKLLCTSLFVLAIIATGVLESALGLAAAPVLQLTAAFH